MTQEVLYEVATGRILQRRDTAVHAYGALPAGTALLAVTPAQWAASLAGMLVQGGTLVAAPAETSAQLVAAAQAAQIRALTAQARAIITGGFASSALGTPHTYGSTSSDQANLTSAAFAASSAATGWETPISCADATGAWELVEHSAAQVLAVKTAEQMMIVAARVKLAALKTSVAAETTVAAVQAITW